jgi:hypothetical protein
VNFLLRRDRTTEALGAIEVALEYVDDETSVLLLGTAAAVHLHAGNRDRAQREVDRAVERGNRAAATALIEALAVRLGLPVLAELLPAPATRAPRWSITYLT